MNKYIHTRNRGGGWGWGVASRARGLQVQYIAWIRPWGDKPHVHISMNRYGGPTFHPGIKGFHRSWSTCLIDVITHTVALCTRAPWQMYNRDQTRKTTPRVFGLYFLTSYAVLQESDYCLISFNKSTPLWIYGPLSLNTFSPWKNNFMHWRSKFVPIRSFYYLESWSIHFFFPI